MTKNEEKVITEVIEKLDGATGRLIVTAIKVPEVKEAMEIIMEANLMLGDLF